MPDTRSANTLIAENIRVHDKVARKYDLIHGEIFNDVEQDRLKAVLKRAYEETRTGSAQVEALDFGCGSGNLTRHLLDLGLHVTAADVSQSFLDLVRRRFPTQRLSTFLMNGSDIHEIPGARFDLIATYSVLHHIPDYLGAVRELARVCKPGGVILIDHEPTEEYWNGDPAYAAFRRQALRFDWKKYLRPSNYLHRIRRIFNPRYSNEGDIHVWPDDHIEWSKIKALLCEGGFEVVAEEDYLLYRGLYRRPVYERYVGRCTDTKVMIFRKCAE